MYVCIISFFYLALVALSIFIAATTICNFVINLVIQASSSKILKIYGTPRRTGLDHPYAEVLTKEVATQTDTDIRLPLPLISLDRHVNVPSESETGLSDILPLCSSGSSYQQPPSTCASTGNELTSDDDTSIPQDTCADK